MKLAFALLALAALAHANLEDETFLENEFKLFKEKFGKIYSSWSERQKRFSIFKDNLKKIQEHNLSGKTWKEGITKFADMTHEEFVSTLNGYVNMMGSNPAPTKDYSKVDVNAMPKAKDWMNVMTPVKDQGSCGSCWAFAGVQSVESYAAINSGELVSLSAQQMTSCTPNELQCGGTGGCSGSIPQLGWTYTQLMGLTTDEKYPYTSGSTGNTGDCMFDPVDTPKAATVMGWEVLPRNNYEAVMDHLDNVGPLSVAVDASVWGFYFGGVFDGCPYDANIAINHAVQLVGYGVDEDSGADYWLIRNSWGPDWGLGGYIRLKREGGDDVQCGTDSTPLSGTACVNDGNDEQYVCGACAVLYDVSYPIGAQLV